MKVVFEITDLSMASLETWIFIRMKTAIFTECNRRSTKTLPLIYRDLACAL